MHRKKGGKQTQTHTPTINTHGALRKKFVIENIFTTVYKAQQFHQKQF
jgi:hypothetical protein